MWVEASRDAQGNKIFNIKRKVTNESILFSAYHGMCGIQREAKNVCGMSYKSATVTKTSTEMIQLLYIILSKVIKILLVFWAVIKARRARRRAAVDSTMKQYAAPWT